MTRNYFVMKPFSSKVRSQSLANTTFSLSRDIYKSLHEMDSFDATTMGIICYTQKNKNVSKNIYWFFIDVTKVCIICTLSEHAIKVKQILGDRHRPTTFPQVFPQSFPQAQWYSTLYQKAHYLYHIIPSKSNRFSGEVKYIGYIVTYQMLHGNKLYNV